jgi:acetylornithine aminotransferase
VLENVAKTGAYLVERLRADLGNVEGVRQIRGIGLMIGIELDRPCGELVTRAIDQGLLINVTMDTVIRMLPPLVLQPAEARRIVEILAPLVKAFLAEPRPQAAKA